MSHIPDICPMCGKYCGSDIHATCEWEWNDQKENGERGNYETYRQEMKAFSKWYAQRDGKI